MKCKAVEKLLPLYLENEVSARQEQEIKKHLERCVSCAALLSELQKVSGLLARIPEVEVSPSLQSRLYAIPALTQKAMPAKKTPRFWELLLSPSLQPALAAASVILVFISFFFFHPDGRLLSRSINEKFHRGYSQVEKFIAKAEGLPGYLPLVRESVENSLKNINLSRSQREENN